MKALFISEQTLLDNSVINENVSFTQIRPTIVKVQEMRIQPIVGSALYSEMVGQVVSGTTTALNTTLLEDYIQPAMVQWLYYELPMVLAFKYMNKGMVRRTSEESSQMSMDEITRLTDKVKNDAERVILSEYHSASFLTLSVSRVISSMLICEDSSLVLRTIPLFMYLNASTIGNS